MLFFFYINVRHKINVHMAIFRNIHNRTESCMVINTLCDKETCSHPLIYTYTTLSFNGLQHCHSTVYNIVIQRFTTLSFNGFTALSFNGLQHCHSTVNSIVIQQFATLSFNGLQHCHSTVYNSVIQWFTPLSFNRLQSCKRC